MGADVMSSHDRSRPLEPLTSGTTSRSGGGRAREERNAVSHRPSFVGDDGGDERSGTCRILSKYAHAVKAL